MSVGSQPAGQHPPPNDPLTAKVGPVVERVDKFWNRVTEGMRVDQLWRQFQTDARSSYRLYSKEVDSERVEGVSKGKHFLSVAGQFFWAILEKLSPPRRVLLLIALVLVFIPDGDATWRAGGGENASFSLHTHLFAGLLMFALLVLEVGDRVVMKHDLQIAKEIQTWLLPASPPSVPGLEIAFATRPANTVAGDYYDVFPRASLAPGEQKWVFAMADVAGKSIPAALLMATIQASLKTLATGPASLPELVSRMNQYACSNSQNGRRFTTAFLAEYEPVTHALTYVNAGHNAPVLRRQSGALEKLERGGIPLGILEAAQYDAGSVVLESGDWLVVFTDGVVEAENNLTEEYGESRLLFVVHSGATLGPNQLLQSIMADLDRFVAGAPQHDDVTCMLVKAT
ncbi:MAG TPA: PP2C family protein-serine/threonine phosphatase [Terriglobales bacterium]